jgi:tRNA pseudouridine55 synthase
MSIAGVGGILLLDKPLGLSSNAALQSVRRALGGVKAGHAGSLDPLASGMLPICIGEATKIAGELLVGRKAYRFTIQLGESRDTGDAEGAVTARCPTPALDELTVAAALARCSGPQLQVPPMYSALKRDGQPLYKLARAGIEVERAARSINIESLQLIAMRDATLELQARVSKGTYIRTLAEQIARELGSCGYVAALRREYVEPFEGAAMLSLEQLERTAPEAVALLGADTALPHLPEVRLNEAGLRTLYFGQSVALGEPPAGAVAPALVRLYRPDGVFFGLGEWAAGGQLRAKRLFSPESLSRN